MKWVDVKKDFKRYLQLERNLSHHSIDAYLNDVQKLEAYCSFKSRNLDQVDTLFIQQFLIFINDFSISPFTQARLLSGMRAFFTFLQIEYGRQDNPTELLESPRLNRKIPSVLNLEEIDALISAIDLSTLEGMRNKTILEVLYGCGLRVSELVTLKISNLYLDVEFIKVEGKGSKERLIPIGLQAIKYLKIYVEEVRPHIPIQAGHEDV